MVFTLKNKSNYYKVFFLLSISLLYSNCSKIKAKKIEDTKQTSAFNNFYEQSEMAALMSDMHVYLEESRKHILQAEDLNAYPTFFQNIHYVQMHEDFERDIIFESYSNAFLEAVEQLYNSANLDKVNLFNHTVNTCIACHTSEGGCSGPIPKIRKLLLHQKE